MDPAAVIGSLVVGLLAGMLSGLFGVGGAVLTTPGIRALGVTPIQAVGSTMPAILPAAVAGALRYRAEGLIDHRVSLTCGLAGSAFAIAGAKAADLMDARWLMVATAGLLLWSGLTSIRSARVALPPVVASRPEASGDVYVPVDFDRVTLAMVGAVAGFVAGLLGIGGGVIMVPMFTNVLKLPVKVAIGSSLVSVSMFSLPAMATHAYLGHIDWPVALLLVVGTIPGARLGSHIAIGSKDRSMRLALGCFFCVIAFIYGGRELAGIF